MMLSHGSHKFVFEGLVVENLDVDALGGTPFMVQNDLTIRPAKHIIILRDQSVIYYGCGRNGSPPDQHSIRHVRRAHILRASTSNATVWPGEFIEVNVPETYGDAPVAIEPWQNAHDKNAWPTPDIIPCIAGKIRIPNNTETPQFVRHSSHFGKVLLIIEVDLHDNKQNSTKAVYNKPSAPFSSSVTLDPQDILPHYIKKGFQKFLHDYGSVFNPAFKGYSSAAGQFEAVVNMGPTQPPQRKGDYLSITEIA